MIDEDAWNGDLHYFKTQFWVEENTDVAAVVLTQRGEAVVWMNLTHVHPDQERLVWHWARFSALQRPPVDVLYAYEMPTQLRDGLQPVGT